MDVRHGTKSPSKQGDKLKNETTAAKAMASKFRSGKKDNSLTLEERKALKKLHKQGRKKARKEVRKEAAAQEVLRRGTEAVSDSTNSQSSEYEDHNPARDTVEAGANVTSAFARKLETEIYSKKQHEHVHARQIKEEEAVKKVGSNPKSRELQKKVIRREMQEAAYKRSAKEAANEVGSLSKRFVDQAEDIAGKVAEFIKEHPKEIAIALAVIILILMICGFFSSCGSAAGGISNIGVTTSYTADDSDILAVDADYREMEENLQDTIDNIEDDYPDYDEYQYELDNIGHNPYQLAAFLTVLYEDYTEAEVQATLQEIFDRQYELSIEEIVEERTREVEKEGIRWVEDDSYEDGGYWETYTYTEEETYNYYILKTTLVNNTMDKVVREWGLNDDQMGRYEILLDTYGNKKYLFEDDIYAIVDPEDEYDVPPEALTDTRFANMLREAERYLGYPYVWGGSKPSTSFDCSGYVCWVINHCGNGWNVGRTTANGLRAHTTRVSPSEARPGDLIFFQGTYDTPGASHVGIYVGNGMMIHCGNPIKYSSINTAFWRSHFMCYGRING